VTAFEADQAIDPNEADAVRNLAYAYYQLERTQDAIKVYRRPLEMDPADEYAAVRLGYLYYNEEDFDQASALLSGPARTSSDPQLLGAGDLVPGS